MKSGWQILASTHNTESSGINIIAQGLDWAYYTTSVRPESTKFTANSGMASLTASNTSLTGSGTVGTDIWDILTAASSGTLIQSLTIKAYTSPGFGMIRFFLYDGTNTKLLTEVPVVATTQSGTATSFFERIDFAGKGFALKSGWKLRATTQVGDATNKFNVHAEGLDWTYPA